MAKLVKDESGALLDPKKTYPNDKGFYAVAENGGLIRWYIGTGEIFCEADLKRLLKWIAKELADGADPRTLWMKLGCVQLETILERAGYRLVFAPQLLRKDDPRTERYQFCSPIESKDREQHFAQIEEQARTE